MLLRVAEALSCASVQLVVVSVKQKAEERKKKEIDAMARYSVLLCPGMLKYVYAKELLCRSTSMLKEFC